MIRWLGSLTGGAMAIGAIVLLVGVPSIVEPTITARVSDDPVPPPPPAVPPNPHPEPLAVQQPVEQPVNSPEPAPVQPALPEPVLVAGQPAPGDAVQTRWHAFWSPFRSQIAANGFVSQLQTVTGLDYRVVAVRPGVYEVTFAYQDEAEITENLAQIAAATGLDVPES